MVVRYLLVTGMDGLESRLLQLALQCLKCFVGKYQVSTYLPTYLIQYLNHSLQFVFSPQSVRAARAVRAVRAVRGNMSRASQLTLAGTSLFAVGTIIMVHFQQKFEKQVCASTYPTYTCLVSCFPSFFLPPLPPFHPFPSRSAKLLIHSSTHPLAHLLT